MSAVRPPSATAANTNLLLLLVTESKRCPLSIPAPVKIASAAPIQSHLTAPRDLKGETYDWSSLLFLLTIHRKKICEISKNSGIFARMLDNAYNYKK
ncbi:predicted protein [Sclerotinia sclerotiorum 1980 UF-70]|uniref:Uncharacterized protein n=1 Tax=Sclerotinia sclerotiorum (strain ATCC 18683 / 1980 / Ss-1) TaxID=665079 RepID=A7EZG9_SCLS1|nr:predicted protein [Sclerotinia sclerotiorum 1980 UF-70]EDN94861.1 predicted protein [Sclerotinia sclerotiorum 1980 UF-70]